MIMNGQPANTAQSAQENNDISTCTVATQSDTNSDTTAKQVSGAETREIVTPYAFKVADELLGQPLASPWRRLFAQLIDLSAIAILSTANAFILALLAALTFFKAGNNLAHRPRRTRTRRLLRFTASLLLFFVIYLIVTAYNDANHYNAENADTGGLITPVLGGINAAAWSVCEDDDCKREVAESFGQAMAENGASVEQVQTVFDALVGRSAPQSNDEAILREYYLNTYHQTIDTAENAQTNNSSEPLAPEITVPSLNDSLPVATLPDVIPADSEPSPSSFSVIDIVEGLIADLGLGFGWAALYYSVFTAWWRGSTPGKRLLGIRVLKLDGSTLTLWESFGRYGGYGAGLATGLLGFVQVFWDPNRQSIQDKIAETLVLKKSDELKRITASGQALTGTQGEGI